MTSEEKKEEMIHTHDVDIAVLKVKLVEITSNHRSLEVRLSNLHGHVDTQVASLEKRFEKRLNDSIQTLLKHGDENQEELLQAITASKWAKEILQSRWKLTGTIVAAGATITAALGGLVVGAMKLIGLLLPHK